MPPIIEVHEDRTHWLIARQSGIGSSDAAVILGESSRSSRLRLYAEKIGLVDEGSADEQEVKPWLLWGHLHEDTIAKHVANETGFKVDDPGEFTIYRSDEFDWMLCTPDRLLTNLDNQAGLLEIKTDMGFHKGNWADGPPLEYEIQVQHQLAVLGLNWAILAVLIGTSDFRMFDIKRNDAFIAELIVQEEMFWQEAQDRTPPEPDDGSEHTHRALKLLYPDDDGSEVELGDDVAHWIGTWERAKEEIANLTTVKDVAEAKVKAAIGNATFGITPAGDRYSLKTSKRKATTINIPEGTYRVLRKAKTDGK